MGRSIAIGEPSSFKWSMASGIFQFCSFCSFRQIFLKTVKEPQHSI